MQIINLLLIHGLTCWAATTRPDGYSAYYRDNMAPAHTHRVLQFMEDHSQVLNSTQKDALSAVLDTIQTQDPSKIDPTVAAVHAVFSESEARFILSPRGDAVSYGVVEERAPNKEANPWCECSSIADFECGLFYFCAWHDQNCGENPKCGLFADLTCDGMCVP